MLTCVHFLRTQGIVQNIWCRFPFELVKIKSLGLKEVNSQLSGKCPPPRKTHYPSFLENQNFPLFFLEHLIKATHSLAALEVSSWAIFSPAE